MQSTFNGIARREEMLVYLKLWFCIWNMYIYFVKLRIVGYYSWHRQHCVKMATLNVIPEIAIHNLQGDELWLAGVLMLRRHIKHHSIGGSSIHLKREYMPEKVYKKN